MNTNVYEFRITLNSGSWLIIMLCNGEVQNSIFDLWIGYCD